MPLFRRRQDWSTLALVLALLPCLLACGDDDDDSGSGPKNADDDDDAGPFPDDDTGGDDDDLNDDSDDDVDDDSADDDTGDDDTHDDDTGDDDTGDDDTGDDDADDDTADDDTGDDDTGDDDTGDDDVQDPIFLGDIAPNEGNNVLSKTVLITGDGFVNGMELAIGGVPIDDWTLVNEQTLIAVLPSGLPAGLNSLTAAHGAASGEGVLDGAYTVDDVIDTYAVISGHVYDRDGLPLQNVRVSSTSGGSATTPSNGFYAFSVPRQSTNVRVSYNAFGPSFLIPKGTLAQTAVNGEALDEDLELDFQIDYDFLHGTVLDADGAPVPNAIVQAFEFNQLSLIDNEMVTDENGEFTMPLFPKTYAFRVDPLPDPSEPGTFVWEFPLDGDGTANWNLHEGNSITGRVLDRDGSGIGPFQILPFVLFKEKSTAFFLSAAISDESGNWSTLMEPGLYEIRLFGMHTDDHLNGLPPFSNPIFATLDVDGPANVDIQFDYAVMDVQITSGGVPIDFPCELNLSSGFNEMRHFSLSAEDAGFVSVPVWKMPLSGAAYPPASSGLTATFSDFGDIAGDDSLTLELEAGERVYGTVTANGIDPLESAVVHFEPADTTAVFQPNYTSEPADENGEYEIYIPAGLYSVTAQANGQDFSGRILDMDDYSVAGEQELSFNVDLVDVRVMLYENGFPSAGANVSAHHVTEDFSGFAFLNGSDPGILRLPQGDYTFVFQPTSGSGSRPFRTAAVTLDENTHRIDLDFQDLPVASD